MTILLYILLGAAVGYAATELFESDDGDDSTDPTTNLVTNGSTLTGSDGSDIFLLDPSETGGVDTTLDAGDGDDVISLTSLFETVGLVGAEVNGGAGNDQIQAQGELSVIDGGDGNDTVEATLLGSTVNGGTGDDNLSVISGPSDPSIVNGGEGNDTLDGRGSDNIALNGDAGNHLILSENGAVVGTGYNLQSDGGAGDDTLRHEIDVFPIPEPNVFAPAELTGGDGADLFDIILTTDNGTFSPDADDPAVFSSTLAQLMDFELGTDTLQIDLSGSLSGYTATSGTLAENTTTGVTELTLRLTGDSLPDQDVQILINATGLTFDDVTFIGTPPPLLSLIPATA